MYDLVVTTGMVVFWFLWRVQKNQGGTSPSNIGDYLSGWAGRVTKVIIDVVADLKGS